jgi:hypothetical protein
LVLLGALYLRAGRRDDALFAFQRGLTLAPQLRQWAADAKLSPEFREAIGVALAELRKKFASFTEHCLEHVRARYLGENLSRLEDGIKGLGGAHAAANLMVLGGAQHYSISPACQSNRGSNEVILTGRNVLSRQRRLFRKNCRQC